MQLIQDLPSEAVIVEVGPRDGLQNEKTYLSVDDKVWLINSLSNTGLTQIETGSFVSPKWVPQMANTKHVFHQIERNPKVNYSALTPNIKGFDAAIASKADSVAVFAAASEAFSRKNINCGIEESLLKIAVVIEAAENAGLPVRGYVSCVLGCPYQGQVDGEAVLYVTKTLLDMGCYEVSLGDTIGIGTPMKTQALLNTLLSQISADKLALHMHDTYAQALANVFVGLTNGIKTFDASVSGLGGCPYASGASGNLATEDIVYMLSNMQIETGIDLNSLADIGNKISHRLNRKNMSKAGVAICSKQGH